MPETPTREAKLTQYLTEAYGTEKQLETALEAHIAMTTRTPYKKRLRQHLSETKRHAQAIDRRIKELGGGDGSLGTVASATAMRAETLAAKAIALAEGPIHAVRGTGIEEKELKNAKTEFASEAEEIATYTAIEALAESVGDRDTAKLARTIRREENRMARYLERLIPQLARAVARAEIPAKERNGGSRRQPRRRTASSTSRRTAASSRGSASRSRGRSAATSRRSGTTSRTSSA